MGYQCLTDKYQSPSLNRNMHSSSLLILLLFITYSQALGSEQLDDLSSVLFSLIVPQKTRSGSEVEATCTKSQKCCWTNGGIILKLWHPFFSGCRLLIRIYRIHSFVAQFDKGAIVCYMLIFIWELHTLDNDYLSSLMVFHSAYCSMTCWAGRHELPFAMLDVCSFFMQGTKIMQTSYSANAAICLCYSFLNSLSPAHYRTFQSVHIFFFLTQVPRSVIKCVVPVPHCWLRKKDFLQNKYIFNIIHTTPLLPSMPRTYTSWWWPGIVSRYTVNLS